MNAIRVAAVAAAGVLLVACAQQGGNSSDHANGAQANGLLVRTCAKGGRIQCAQQPFTVRLRRPDGSEYAQTLEPPIPVVQDSAITVLAGQTVNVEATAGADGALTGFRLVSEVSRPQSTLTFKLEQLRSDGAPDQMALEVHNPFGRWLTYHAAINPLARESDFYPTSICPVGPDLGGYELWATPIFRVRLSDFRLLDAGAGGLVCRR